MDSKHLHKHVPMNKLTLMLFVDLYLRYLVMKHFILFIVPVFIAIILSSCNTKSDQPQFMPIEPSEKDTLLFLALGDSYTIGERVDTSERWPVQLGVELEKQFQAILEVSIIARTGWTTRNLINGIEDASPAGPFDMVSLLIGVNNQYQGRDTAEYRQEFRELLQEATGFAGGISEKVIVVSIPDYGVTPFASGSDPEKIAREIDDFNSINLQETGKTGAVYVDVTPISRLAANDLSLLASDGLHPSGKMYSEWVKIILPEAINILEKK